MFFLKKEALQKVVAMMGASIISGYLLLGLIPHLASAVSSLWPAKAQSQSNITDTAAFATVVYAALPPGKQVGDTRTTLPPGTQTGSTNTTVPPGTGSSGATDTKISFKNPLKFNSVELLLTALTQWAIRIGTLIAIFFFILAGFKYVTALGDESKLKDAKRSLWNAAIGTAILVGADVIMTIVRNTLESIKAP